MNVYVIYFRNGKRYVGVETKPGSRIGDHRRMATLRPSYKGRPQLVDLAVRKYGWETVSWRYLAANCTNEEGWALEKVFIRLFCTQDPEWGYNISAGGDKCAAGVKRSPEFCEMLSERGKRNGTSHLQRPEVIAKRAATQSRQRKGQRAWNKGRKGSSKATHTSFKPGMTPWNKGGGDYSAETRAKMSASQRARDPATRKGNNVGQVPWNRGLKLPPTGRKCPFQDMVALPAGPNGERRWFRPEQLI